MSVLSVDLGTSNTVAVLAAHGRQPRVVEVEGSAAMPSAVFAAEGGRFVVGREAERRARLDPARFEPNPKRRVDEGTLLLGDRVVPVSEAFAAVLGKVAGEVSRQLGGGRADEVRLTHPAQWGPVRRNVLLSAARQAGLGTNLVLVPEPVAAAAHFASFPGRGLAPGQALAVYDLGAGTFDVAVVADGYTVLAEAGLPDLGGLDVDQALLAHVGRQVSARDPHAWHRLMLPTSTADRRARRALQEDVRAAKEALSAHPQTDLPLPEPFHDALVTRAELEALIRPSLLRSVELLSATVRSAGLTQDRLAGVYLVGGSSRIPLVATLIAEQLRIVATNLDQPETAVALGAHHVARAAVGLRTENVAGAVVGVPAIAAPEERTTHIAPPPRSPTQPSLPVASPGHNEPHMPTTFRRAAPTDRWPGTQAPSAKPGTRRTKIYWLIGAAALVVVLAGVMILPSLLGGEDGVNLASPKALPSGMPCTDILPTGAVGEAFGDRAQSSSGITGFDSELCAWSDGEDGKGGQSSAVLSSDTYYRPSPDDEAFVLGGNDAYVHAHITGNSCSVEVAIRSDRGLSMDVNVKGLDRQANCTAAKALLMIVLDNLPDA